MQIVTGITVAPRVGEQLLDRCVDSLAQAGFWRPMIFAEPDSPITQHVRYLADVVQRDTKLGEWNNWLLGLRQLLDKNPTADAVMMVQDDVYFCTNIDAWLQEALWPSPHCGAVHVYSSRRYRNQPRGLSKLDTEQAFNMAGACAIVFPRNVADELVRYGMTQGWRGHTLRLRSDPPSNKMEGVDTYIGETLTAMDYEIWVHNPSMSEHDSTYSTLGHGNPVGACQGLRFPGADANPFDLYPHPLARFFGTVTPKVNSGMPHVIDICIPTIKSPSEIEHQIVAIKWYTGTPCNVIRSCALGSAAENRNRCLRKTTSDIIIMVDDDVSGFFNGWEKALVAPLLADENVMVVSARLINPDGTIQNTCCSTKALEPHWIEIKPRAEHVMPAAAIAFRNVGLRFDEQYVGSGYEDGDFCRQYLERDEKSKFILTNDCRLIHANEMKNQGHDNLITNRDYFRQKWKVGQC